MSNAVHNLQYGFFFYASTYYCNFLWNEDLGDGFSLTRKDSEFMLSIGSALIIIQWANKSPCASSLGSCL